MRTKDTPEKRQRMIRYFIEAGASTIKEVGVNNFTIRRAANQAGYNSATIYNYFQNSRQLLSLSLLHIVSSYFLNIKKALFKNHDSTMAFLLLWKNYALNSFNEPEIYQYVFNSQASRVVLSQLQTYFRIYTYPHFDLNDPLVKRILGSSIEERDRLAIDPLVEQGLIKREQRQYILDFAYALELGMSMQKRNNDDPELLVHKFMDYLIEFLLTHSKITTSKEDLMLKLFKLGNQ